MDSTGMVASDVDACRLADHGQPRILIHHIQRHLQRRQPGGPRETEHKLLTLSDKPRAATALTISCQRARLDGLLGLIARRQDIKDSVGIRIDPLSRRISRYDVGVPNQAYSST